MQVAYECLMKGIDMVGCVGGTVGWCADSIWVECRYFMGVVYVGAWVNSSFQAGFT